jgi:hypothetical protein
MTIVLVAYRDHIPERIPMPAKSRRTSAISYQLKITLRGSKPPIWRRILVPADCDLETLHYAIQALMGWENDHLHCFTIDNEQYMGRDPMGGKMDSDGLDALKYRLSDVIRQEKVKFTYQYDFGDSWDHAVTLEKILPPPAPDAPKSPAFSCLAGAGACPPEDCGGLWGYYRLLEILQDPQHEEHEQMKDWAGPIDPDAFDLAAINKRLAHMGLT